jgi:hypothetical protein
MTEIERLEELKMLTEIAWKKATKKWIPPFSPFMYETLDLINAEIERKKIDRHYADTYGSLSGAFNCILPELIEIAPRYEQMFKSVRDYLAIEIPRKGE